MTRGVCSRHCFDRIDSVRVDRQAGSSLLLNAVLSCKKSSSSLYLPCRRNELGLCEAMESKIMVTIPCQFSSSWSSNKCHVCLLAKSIVWVLPPGGLSESPKFTKNFLQAWPWAFSKKKHTMRNCQCPRGLRGSDSFCPRRELFDIDAGFSLCKKTPHTYPTHYTIHTHTHSTVKESCLAWFVVADHEEGEAEVKKVESLLLCLGKRAVLELQAVHVQLLWFSTMFESCWSKNCTNLLSNIHAQSDRARPSRLIWSPKRHFVAIDLPVAEKTPKCMCYPILGQRKLKGQQHRQAARLKKSAKQLLFWSGQWSSDSSCSATDGSFDIALGKTLGIGEFPSLDQSAPVYLYWPPGPFLATQYDKEPGGAGFEASQF